MIYIYPKQLPFQLINKLYSCYLVVGSDRFLLKKIIDKICQKAKQKGFTECYNYSLSMFDDWEIIYNFIQSTNMFANRRILILEVPENNTKIITAEKIFKLTKLLHPDILLILMGNKLTKIKDNSNWFKNINQAVYINCSIPKHFKLNLWVTQIAKAMSITLDKSANQLLCYCYNKNLLDINQILKQLALLYPNDNITLSKIKKVIANAINYNPYHWIDAMLSGKIKQSYYIIQQLQHKNYEIVILLRIIQNELLLLLSLKQQNNKNLKKLFDEHKIWQSRRCLITNALQRLSLISIQSAIKLVIKAEFDLEQNCNDLAWIKLKTLSMILCGSKSFSESFY